MLKMQNRNCKSWKTELIHNEESFQEIKEKNIFEKIYDKFQELKQKFQHYLNKNEIFNCNTNSITKFFLNLFLKYR